MVQVTVVLPEREGAAPRSALLHRTYGGPSAGGRRRPDSSRTPRTGRLPRGRGRRSEGRSGAAAGPRHWRPWRRPQRPRRARSEEDEQASAPGRAGTRSSPLSMSPGGPLHSAARLVSRAGRTPQEPPGRRRLVLFLTTCLPTCQQVAASYPQAGAARGRPSGERYRPAPTIRRSHPARRSAPQRSKPDPPNELSTPGPPSSRLSPPLPKSMSLPPSP